MNKGEKKKIKDKKINSSRALNPVRNKAEYGERRI
jgi:hypothetical protein